MIFERIIKTDVELSNLGIIVKLDDDLKNNLVEFSELGLYAINKYESFAPIRELLNIAFIVLTRNSNQFVARFVIETTLDYLNEEFNNTYESIDLENLKIENQNSKLTALEILKAATGDKYESVK